MADEFQIMAAEAARELRVLSLQIAARAMQGRVTAEADSIVMIALAETLAEYIKHGNK